MGHWTIPPEASLVCVSLNILVVFISRSCMAHHPSCCINSLLYSAYILVKRTFKEQFATLIHALWDGISLNMSLFSRAKKCFHSFLWSFVLGLSSGSLCDQNHISFSTADTPRFQTRTHPCLVSKALLNFLGYNSKQKCSLERSVTENYSTQCLFIFVFPQKKITFNFPLMKLNSHCSNL